MNTPAQAGDPKADSVSAESTPTPEASEDTGEAVLTADGLTFVTGNATDEERAAVIAVLAQARSEETERVRRVGRRERAPWSRSQRTPEGIAEYLS